MNYQRTNLPERRDSFTSANVNHFLCEIANKNLVCIDNLLEQNRVIQNYLIDENASTYQEESFITMFSNIVNRNFQLAETILNQNDNIQTYFINNINQITNSTNNNNHSTNNHSTTNNNNQSTSNHSTNNQSTTNSLYTNNNNLQPINNNLQPINNNLQPERRSLLNNHNRYLNNLDTHLSSLNNLSTNLVNSLYPERQTNNLSNANNLSFQILYNSLPDISYSIEFYDISLNDPFFDSVRPVPSETQIDRAIIQTLRYSDIISPVNDICPITREPFTDNSAVSVIRHCKHIFNRTELTNWFRYNCVCPVCRYDIRDYPENSNSNSNNNNNTFNNNSQNNLNTSQLNNVITQTMLDLINEVTRQPR